MSGIDITVVVIIGLFTLIGAWRGLFKEILSLLGIVAGVVAAFRAHGVAEGILINFFPHFPGICKAVSMGVVFLVVTALIGLLSLFLKKVVVITGMGPIDRTLGAVFGFVRALIVVSAFLVVIVASFPQGKYWIDRSPVSQKVMVITKATIKLASPEVKELFKEHWSNPQKPKKERV
jgi:membrane protein required for colicin V production